MTYVLFTYGTLMKGNRNHYLIENSKYLCDGVLNDYGLYEIGTFPGAINKHGFRVYGEVYEIDDAIKELLDRLEDEGNVYNFKKATINTDNGPVEASFYEFIDKSIKYPLRKPDGKWNTTRNDI